MKLACGLFIVVCLGLCSCSRSVDVRQGDSSATTDKQSRFSSDFKALDQWCTTSCREIQSTFRDNPLRGNELGEKYLSELEKDLVGANVHWAMTVVKIEPSTNKIWLNTASDGGIRPLEVFFNEEDKPLHAYASVFSLRVDDETLRDFTVGKTATVHGSVEYVEPKVPNPRSSNCITGFRIKLANAKIVN